MKTYSPREVTRQAGTLPWRYRTGRLQILLVTNSQKNRWIVPKGNICHFETAVDAAQKESFEEAGLIGDLAFKPIGMWIYQKKNRRWQAVELFPMRVLQVLDNYPEVKVRQRTWVDWRKARKHINDKQLVTIIKELPTYLQAHWETHQSVVNINRLLA